MFSNRQHSSSSTTITSLNSELRSCILTEEEMGNRERLRVQKNKHTKRRGNKVFLKTVFDYLKSDTFMYAPLLLPPPSHAFNSAAQEVEFKKPAKDNKQFGEQVMDYLKSDVYMYNPLLHLPRSPQEPVQDCGINRKDDSTRRLTMKVNQRTDRLGNTNQSSQIHLPQTDISDQHTLGRRETVKHTVYQSCRSTSVPRIVTLNSQLRAHSLLKLFDIAMDL